MAGAADLYGVGKAGAQVWQGNPALGLLQQKFAQDMAERRRQDDEFDAEFAKANYDAVKEADLSAAIGLYDKVKNTFSQLRKTTNSHDRALLAAKMGAEKNQLAQFVNASKMAGQEEGEFAKMLRTNPDMAADDAFNKLLTLKKTPTGDKKYLDLVNDFGATWQSKPYDLMGLANKIKPLATRKTQDRVEKPIEGGKEFITIDRENIDKNKVIGLIVSEAQNDKALMRRISKEYPDLPFPHATMAFAEKMADQLSVLDTEKESVQRWRTGMTDAQKDASARGWANVGLRQQAGGVTEAPKDAVLSYGDIGQHKVTGRSGQAIRKPGVSFQGSPAYNLQEAKFETITEPTSKYEVVSLYYYPIATRDLTITKGKGTSAEAKTTVTKGSLVGDDYAKNNPGSVQWKPKLLVADGSNNSWLIDPDNWPKNQFTKKDEAIVNSVLGNPYQQSNQSTQAKKTIKGF